MKKVCIFLVATIYSWNVQAQLSLGSSASLHLTGNAQITLQDIDLINNGDITMAENARFSFTGTANNTLYSTGLMQFSELEIQKSGSGQLQLGSDIGVSEKIIFTSNHIDLNQHTIHLASTGLLENENENSRLTGLGGGEIIITTVLDAPSSANPGNLGAVISSSTNLGNTSIHRGHSAQIINGQETIHRYYEITPTQNDNLNAVLRFYYFDAELNGYAEDDLTQWRSSDYTNWTEEGKSAHDVLSNYVERNAMPSFARHSLRQSVVLPLSWGELSSKCAEGTVWLYWQTLQEQNNSYFTVEESVAGFAWTPIAQIDAAENSSTVHSYQYQDLTAVPLYRIQQTDRDGRSSYSKIISVDCGTNRNIQVYPNPVQEGLTVSVISEKDQPVKWILLDSKAARIFQQSKHVQAGENSIHINMQQLAKGTYWLLFVWSDGERKTIQLSKQ